MNIAVVIIASLISGLISVIVSTVYYKKHERYLRKLKTLKDFAGYRWDIMGPNFTRALNEIFIVFKDSKKVKSDLMQFHRTITSRNIEIANDDLIKLFKSMCEDLKINPDEFSESFFLKPFNARKE